MDHDEGQAPEKIEDQGKMPKGHKHLSNTERKETENEVKEVRAEPVSRCGKVSCCWEIEQNEEWDSAADWSREFISDLWLVG